MIKETSNTTLTPKKRGRPAGSKNKPKAQAIKRGRPVGSTNKPKESTIVKRGRPAGNHTKPKVAVKAVKTAPTKPTTLDTLAPTTSRRKQPITPRNTTQLDLPKVEYTLEPILGFKEIIKKFGDKGYMVYQVSNKSMELKAEDMAKAIQKYKDKYRQLPTRAILNEHNEKLLPYLNAEVPNIEIGLAVGGTASWEIQLQVP